MIMNTLLKLPILCFYPDICWHLSKITHITMISNR